MNKMVNGIAEISSIDTGNLAGRDLYLGQFVALGCSVSSMPKNLKNSDVSYSDKWELFDPEQVESVDDLPDYWRKVYKKHNGPRMGDCVDLRFRYVHCPEEILPSYPRVSCKGIFCLDSRNVSANNIKADNLIFVGDEFV